jgi:hypothetical protein
MRADVSVTWLIQFLSALVAATGLASASRRMASPA